METFLNRQQPDQRRFLRYEVLDYAVASSGANHLGFNAVVTDIGLGGLQLRARQGIVIGTPIRIQVGRLDLPPLTLRGEVRHCEMVPGSDLYSMGIRFTPEAHEERMAIAEYVHGVFQRQCDLLSP